MKVSKSVGFELETIQLIEKAAKKANISVSKWIDEACTIRLKSEPGGKTKQLPIRRQAA